MNARSSCNDFVMEDKGTLGHLAKAQKVKVFL
jgi:hypothetical protein